MKINAVKAKELLRKNLALVITVLVMLVLLLLVYVPKLSTLSALKEDFEAKAEDLRSNHEFIDRLVEIGADHQAAKVELERLHREHAGHHQIPETLHSLTAAVGHLNLELRAINRSPQERGRFFVKVPLELHIESSYRSFAEYTDRITRVARLLDIRLIEISHTGNI